MNPNLQSLIDLYEVDHEIFQTRQQLERYPKMIAAMDDAEKVHKRLLDEAAQSMDAARSDGRRLEKDVLALRARMAKYKSQQGSVKTNKDYQAMKGEIERIEAEIDAKETEGLEQLEADEASEKQRAGAEAALKELAAKHRPERERIATQIAEKKARLERLAGERARRLEAVEGDWRETYELLNERFPGSACSPIEGDHCGACQWSLVAVTVQHVRAGQEIVRCDHCRRILFAEAGR